MNRYKKKLIIDLLIAIFLFTFFGIGVFFFSNNLKKFSKRVEKSRQELESRSKSVKQLADLGVQYSKGAGPYLNVLYNVVPKKDELINFSREVQTIANSENLEFGFSFLGETPATEGKLGSVKFGVNMTGESLDNIFNFVKKLQGFRYLTNLESLQISESDTESKIRATFRGEVFFRI